MPNMAKVKEPTALGCGQILRPPHSWETWNFSESQLRVKGLQTALLNLLFTQGQGHDHPIVFLLSFTVGQIGINLHTLTSIFIGFWSFRAFVIWLSQMVFLTPTNKDSTAKGTIFNILLITHKGKESVKIDT